MTKSFPIKTLPETEAPPNVVKLPPDPRPVEFEVLEIYMGQDDFKVFDSNDNCDNDTSGLVPSPITNLFAVKLDLPVPP
jgi:hypothetical protein